MREFTVREIGRIRSGDDGFRVELAPEYRPALDGLDGFGYIQLIWWFDGCDNDEARRSLAEYKPYTNGPEIMGTFATRSPERANPIALSCAYVTYIDHERGVIALAYTDANDNTPLLDIKPYTPSLDRVESPTVPKWCAHWPGCVEASGDFDWESEFNF